MPLSLQGPSAVPPGRTSGFGGAALPVPLVLALALAGALSLAPAARAQPLVPYRAEVAGAPAAPSGDVAVVAVPGAPEHGRLLFGRGLEAGLAAVSLDGGLRGAWGVELGPFGGVDALALPDLGWSLVAAGASVSGQVRLWRLSPDGGVADAFPTGVSAFNAGPVALGRTVDGGVELVFAGGGSRQLERVRLVVLEASSTLGAERLEGLELPLAPLGLALGRGARQLLAVLADGSFGVLALDADGAGSAGGSPVWEAIATPGAGSLGGAAQAVAAYGLADGGTVALVSVPARGEIVVFAAGPSGFGERGRFAVGNDASIQRVRAPRHLAVTAAAAGAFPGGLLAVQDVEGTGAGPSYKLVGLHEAAALLDGGLPVDACAPCLDGGADAGGGAVGGLPCWGPGCRAPDGPTPPPAVLNCTCGPGTGALPLWGALALGLASWRKSRRKGS